MRKMARFETERAAKEYLIERIVAEAKRGGVPLTEVERKMLYFTESGWTLPNILEVNAAFERDYDDDEYERKIAELARRIEESDAAKGAQDQANWDAAVAKLSEGDHYLLVLIDTNLSTAGTDSSFWDRLAPWIPVADGRPQRKPGDFGRLILTAFIVIFGWALLNYLLRLIFSPDWKASIRHFLR
jgi:hypothetical protein